MNETNEPNETTYRPSEPHEPPPTTTAAPPETKSRTPLILLIVAAGLTIFACIACLVALLAFGLFSTWTTTSSSSGGATVVEESEAFQRVTVPGAGIALDLPGSMSRIDAMADEFSGTWWYEYDDATQPKVFIATYRYDDWVPEITDAYLRDVIDDVEESSGNRDVSISEIDEVVVDGYEGRQVNYNSTTEDDLQEYTAAILLGREEDEIFIAVYGTDEQREDIDTLAEWLFQSMSVWSTPETYSIQGI